MKVAQGWLQYSCQIMVPRFLLKPQVACTMTSRISYQDCEGETEKEKEGADLGASWGPYVFLLWLCVRKSEKHSQLVAMYCTARACHFCCVFCICKAGVWIGASVCKNAEAKWNEVPICMDTLHYWSAILPTSELMVGRSPSEADTLNSFPLAAG